MGCDGGTIPRRDELVRTKKKPEQKDKNAETVAKWKHCAITQNPLHKPIVACELGKLYNKEAVLEHLLKKDGVTAEVAGHIKKLSDVKELNLTEKAGFEAKNNQKGDEYVDFHDSRYMCPVTGLEMNGRQRFYFLWKCGCVISERAIKEVKSETCHKCGKPFEEKDVIIMNGTEEEIKELHGRMTERRRLSKLEKKKKKSESALGSEAKKIKIESEESNGIVPSGNTPVLNGVSNDTKLNMKLDAKVKIEPGSSSPSTSGMSKLVNGKNTDKNGINKASKLTDLPDKAKKAYSIAKDPTASETFKSLFTSHPNAKKQDNAHWITHNPCYY